MDVDNTPFQTKLQDHVEAARHECHLSSHPTTKSQGPQLSALSTLIKTSYQARLKVCGHIRNLPHDNDKNVAFMLFCDAMLHQTDTNNLDMPR